MCFCKIFYFVWGPQYVEGESDRTESIISQWQSAMDKHDMTKIVPI